MDQNIPASQIVSVIPSVISAGGSGLDLIALGLTNNTRVPVGVVASFPDLASVSSFFGSSSTEAAKAGVYFNGFDGSTKKPGAILFSQYPAAPVSAYLRGARVSQMALATLQALSGPLSITIDGYARNTGTINLASAGSFSVAAGLIQAALDTAVSVTASIDPNVVTGHIDPNVVTASIAGTTMTVTAVATGVLAASQGIAGVGVANGTTIVAQLTGTAGSTGTYQVSISQTVVSTAVTATGGGLTVTAVTTGTLAAGQTLTGAGVTAGTKILAGGTGTGGTGTYPVDKSQTVGSETITGSGGTMTVTAVGSGVLGLGDVLQGAGVTTGNSITALLTGAGLTGTYMVSVGDTVGSETVTVAGAAPTVTYDSVSGAFVIASSLTGAASTIGFAATGTLATALAMTQATGATLSQGAAAAAPAAAMDAVLALTQNWATLFTVFEPSKPDKVAFAAWINSKGNRFLYACRDTDATPTASNDSTSAGYQIKQAGYSGTSIIYEPSDQNDDVFLAGALASIDFTAANGRIDPTYKHQSGIVPGVVDGTIAANLKANAYNYYGSWSTANQNFAGLAPGSISGPFAWIDDYVNQIWLNNQFQLSLMGMLFGTNFTPYNRAGYTKLETTVATVINQAILNGIIQSGVTLSGSQISAVNAAAGLAIDQILFTRGWYLQVLDPGPTVRAARGSPVCKFFYTTGGSIHQINFGSVEVQ